MSGALLERILALKLKPVFDYAAGVAAPCAYAHDNHDGAAHSLVACEIACRKAELLSQEWLAAA